MAISDKRLKEMRSPYGVYKVQKHRAFQRGIEFELTFEEWLEVWGYCLPYRGRRKDQLCMCRKGDTGPYKVGNVYIDTMNKNRASVSVDDHRKHSKINMETASDIRDSLARGIPVRKCAEIYGISRQSIQDIKAGRTWRS